MGLSIVNHPFWGIPISGNSMKSTTILKPPKQAVSGNQVQAEGCHLVWENLQPQNGGTPTHTLWPSGKRLHNYGKSPVFMSKSTINMAILTSYVRYQRVRCAILSAICALILIQTSCVGALIHDSSSLTIFDSSGCLKIGYPRQTHFDQFTSKTEKNDKSCAVFSPRLT